MSTTIGGAAGTYAYNGDGLRTTRTAGGAGVSYVWDQNAGLPVVLQDSAGNRYVYGLDLLMRVAGATEEWYLYDGLGSTTGLATGTGAATDAYAYDVFGAQRSHTGSSPNEFTFTGEQVDGTGLQYLRARYYDPGTGRFVSRDPLPLLQRYAYAGNNPAMFVDPTGLCCKVFKKIKHAASSVASAVGDAVTTVAETSAVVAGAVADAANATVGLATSSVASAVQGSTWLATKTSDFARGLKSLNCLDATLAIAAIAASALLPEFSPEISLAYQLAHAGLAVGEHAAFAVAAGINASQIDRKEGWSFNNIVNGIGIGAGSFAAATSPMELAGAGKLKAIGKVGVFGAAAVSTFQCLQGGVGNAR